jgi:uncharacterized protein YndB with AHSA1/START domain
MAEGTGILRTTGDGLELVLARHFTAPPEEVWAWVTESEKLEQWIGRWTGEAGVGKVVEFTMTAEASATPEQVTIIDCDPPKRLQAEFASEAGTWHLQLDVAMRGNETVLQFNQLIEQGDDITKVGPGWEYYLDRLVAIRAGLAPAPFDDYYPALVGYYDDLE